MEGSQRLARLGHLGGARSEGGVDGVHLAGVNGRLGGEAQRAHAPRFGLDRGRVIQRQAGHVDRGNAGARARAGQRRAGEQQRIPRGRHAQLGGIVHAAQHDGADTGRGGDLEGLGQPGRGLDQRRETGRGQQPVRHSQDAGRFDLGHEHHAWWCLGQRQEVGRAVRIDQLVDPDRDARVGRLAAEARHVSPCRPLGIGAGCILEIDDHQVGAGGERLGPAVGPPARDKQDALDVEQRHGGTGDAFGVGYLSGQL